MALGASRSLVVWSVVREALWLVVTGLVIGLPVVFLGGRLISTLLFGVSPFDSLSVIAATLVLVSVGGSLQRPPGPSRVPGRSERRAQKRIRAQVRQVRRIRQVRGTS